MTCFYMPNGESLRKYCKRKNISYKVMWYRLDEGYSLKEALKITKQRMGKHSFPKIKCNGEYLINICDRNTYYRVYMKMKHHNISCEEAIKRDKLKYGGLR